MSHFFVILKFMMKHGKSINNATGGGWEQGLKLLVKSTTTKVIFTQSVTRVDDFVDTVDILRDQIKKCEEINPDLTVKFREMFLKPPFIIYNFFLRLSDEGLTTKDSEYLDRCLKMLKQEDLNMLHSDIDEIFFEFESNEPRIVKIQRAYKDRFFV